MYSDDSDYKKNRSQKQSFMPMNESDKETGRLKAEERRRKYSRLIGEAHYLINQALEELDKRDLSNAKSCLAKIYRIEHEILMKFGNLDVYKQEDKAKMILLESELKKLGIALPDRPSIISPQKKGTEKKIQPVSEQIQELPTIENRRPVRKKQIVTVGDFARTVEDLWGRLWNNYRHLYSKESDEDKEAAIFSKPLDYFFHPLAKTLDNRQSISLIKDILGVDPHKRRPLIFFMTSMNAIMTPELFLILFGEYGIIPDYIEEFIILDVQIKLNRDDYQSQQAYESAYQKAHKENFKKEYKEAYQEKLTNVESIIDIYKGAANLIEDLIKDWESKEDYEDAREFITMLIQNPVFLLRVIQARDTIRLIKFELDQREYPEFATNENEINYISWLEKRKSILVETTNAQLDRLMNILITRVDQEVFEGILKTLPRLFTEMLVLYSERVMILSKEIDTQELSEHRLELDIQELVARLSTIQCLSRLLHTATFNTEGKEKGFYEGIEQEIEQLKNEAIQAKQRAELKL